MSEKPKMWDGRVKSSSKRTALTSIFDCEDRGDWFIVPADIETVYKLGYGYYCAEGKSLIIPNTVKVIQSECAFRIGLTGLAVDCEKISSFAFERSFLEKLILLDGVKEIGEFAFSFCNFPSVNVPGSVKKISECAFSLGCLREVIICDGVLEIHRKAFNKNAIEKLVLPASIENIADDAFEDAFAQYDKVCVYVEPNSYAERYMNEKFYGKVEIIYMNEKLKQEFYSPGEAERREIESICRRPERRMFSPLFLDCVAKVANVPVLQSRPTQTIEI